MFADRAEVECRIEAALPAESVTARVVSGEFAATYRIPGEANVPSDNVPHKFVVSERACEAKLVKWGQVLNYKVSRSNPGAVTIWLEPAGCDRRV